MLASRVRKARRNSTCPLCHAPVTTGQHIGLTEPGWCHVTCIIRENSDDRGTDPAGLAAVGTQGDDHVSRVWPRPPGRT